MGAPSQLSRRLLWAAAAGLLTALAVALVLPLDAAPMVALRVLAGSDLAPVDVSGGVRIHYRARGRAPSDELVTRAAYVIERRVRALPQGGEVIVSDEGGEAVYTVALFGVTVEPESDAGPMLAPNPGVDLARSLVGRGDLRMQLEVSPSDSDFMARLCPRAEADPAITCVTNTWIHPITGNEVLDHALESAERAPLERFLAAATRDPDLAPEPGDGVAAGRVFAVERVQTFEPGAPARWRSHYLERRVEIDHDDIADAFKYWDETSLLPAVSIELTPEGGERFHRLTAESIGRKLVILRDDLVVSAPMIRDAIPGGRVLVSMGSDRTTAEAEADTLVAALRTRLIASGELLQLLQHLEIGPVQAVTPVVTIGQRRAVVALLVLLAGIFGFAFGFAVERRAPSLTPGPNQRPGRPWGRLVFTCAAALAVHYGAPLVSLPGIDLATAKDVTVGLDIDIEAMMGNVFVLGLGPIFSAFVLVELAALLVPRWRRLRIGGPDGRARLGRPTAIVSVLLALLGGYSVALWLEGLSVDSFAPGIMLDPGLASRLTIACTLAAAVFVLWFVASAISRYGLGNGFSVLLATAALDLPSYLFGLRDSSAIADDGRVVVIALALCVVVVVTSRILRVRAGGPLGLRLPTCGVIPIVEAGALAGALGLAAGTVADTVGAALSPSGQPLTATITQLGLVATLAVVFSFAFSWPDRPLGRARLIDPDAQARRRAAFWRGTVTSTLYLLAASALTMAVARWVVDSPYDLVRAGTPYDLVGLIVATAVAMDLLAEWRALRGRRDLVSVWPVHRVQVLSLALDALRGAGIEAHARGAYHRSLLHFFGPFVPIELMVPAADADRARQLVHGLLGQSDLPVTDAGAGDPSPADAGPAAADDDPADAPGTA
ncbi:SecDF P1 head subdomain-containing protein [Haliangium sp.]|uniref:SecDF P1 head subdomain-containing protein n=1 Tax=Haliangium sp. TaxID=2663208 RepID=UPI003D13F78A